MGEVWFVYILECMDGSFYTGVTNDLDKRMSLHAARRGSKYVATRGFKGLLASRPCGSKSLACKAECQIKKLPRGQKLGWFG